MLLLSVAFGWPQYVPFAHGRVPFTRVLSRLTTPCILNLQYMRTATAKAVSRSHAIRRQIRETKPGYIPRAGPTIVISNRGINPTATTVSGSQLERINETVF